MMCAGVTTVTVARLLAVSATSMAASLDEHLCMTLPLAQPPAHFSVPIYLARPLSRNATSHCEKAE